MYVSSHLLHLLMSSNIKTDGINFYMYNFTLSHYETFALLYIPQSGLKRSLFNLEFLSFKRLSWILASTAIRLWLELNLLGLSLARLLVMRRLCRSVLTKSGSRWFGCLRGFAGCCCVAFCTIPDTNYI